jgi:hypothetical protein
MFLFISDDVTLCDVTEWLHDIQQNDIQHDGIEPKELICDTPHK